jgi:hypothetical protein
LQTQTPQAAAYIYTSRHAACRHGDSTSACLGVYVHAGVKASGLLRYAKSNCECGAPKVLLLPEDTAKVG